MKKNIKRMLAVVLALAMLIPASLFMGVTAADGFTLRALVLSEDNGADLTVKLMQNGVEKYQTVIPAELNSTQLPRITGIAAGTYDLVAVKAGHLPFTVTGIVINRNIDLMDSANDNIAGIKLVPGDIDSDGFIDGGDVSLFVFDMGKSPSEAANPYTDLNGDGYRDETDVTVLSFNLFATAPVYAFDNPPATTFKVSFAGGEGAVGTAPASVDVIKGEATVLPANTFTNGDKVFVGWSDGSRTYTAGQTYCPSADITLTAVWRSSQFSVYKTLYSFETANDNGSSWWGTEIPAPTAGGVSGKYLSVSAGKSVICGNMVAPGSSHNLSMLNTDGYYLSFWVYLAQAGETMIAIDLTSQRDAPKVEVSASFVATVSAQGWNQVVLALDDAYEIAQNFDITNVQFIHFRMPTSVCAWGVDELTVGYYGDTAPEIETPEQPEVPAEETVIPLTMAETDANFWGQGTPYVDITNYAEGRASVAAEHDSCAVICYSIENSPTGIINASMYEDNLTAHLSIYVEDVTKLNLSAGHSMFEIYAGDAASVNGNDAFPCYAWNIGDKLQNGWNELELSFSTAAKISAGNNNPDLSKLRSFRFFNYTNGSTKVAIDNVYLTSSVVLAKYYANNLKSVDTMSAMSGSSLYSSASWSQADANAVFTSNAARIHDSGSASLSINAGRTGVIAKRYSNMDLSAYKDGYFYTWIYVSDASNITGGQLEFTSSTQPDCYETSWNVTSLGLKDGWNEIKLSLKNSAFASNDANWSIINYIRFYFSVSAKTEISIEGIYFGTAEQIEALSVTKAPTSKEVLVIENCDSSTNWIGSNITFVSVENSDEVEGKGYIKSSLSGAGDIVYAKRYQATDHWMNAQGATVNTWRIDLREYLDSQLVFSLYVSNPAAIIGGQIELCSSGGSDVDELSWGELGSTIPLVSGWNTIVLDFADANRVGNPNLAEINYMRIYLNCNAAVETAIDNIYLGDASEFSTVTFTASDIISGPSAVTVTKSFNYKDGARIRLLDIPEIGYKADTNFLGWSDGVNLYKNGDYVTVSGDVTYTAVYAEKAQNSSVIYAFDMNDGGTDGDGIFLSNAGFVDVESAVAGTPNATAENAVWIKSPTFGTVLDFSIEGAYMTAGAAGKTVGNQFNAEIWFNLPQRTNTLRYLFVSTAISAYVNPADGSLTVNVGGTNITVGAAELGKNILDGTWHHLSAVYDNGSVTIYVDGVSVKSASASVNASASITGLIVGASHVYGGFMDVNNNANGHLARFALSHGTQNYYGYSSVTIAASEYDSSTSLTLEKGIVIDRRQYWNYNPYVNESATVTPVDLKNIQDLGFDHVKLLLTPNWIIDDYGNLVYEKMDYIGPLLDEIVALDFQCILCIHPEEGFKGTYLNLNNLYLLNQFYQDFTAYVVEHWGVDNIAIQLMTEPNSNTSQVSWDWIVDRTWGAARNMNADIMLITSSEDNGNAERLKDMSPVFDYNLVYSFTTYEPYTIGFNNYQQSSFWPYVKDVAYPVPAGMNDEQINSLIESNIVNVPENLKADARYMLGRYYRGEWDSFRPNPYSGVLYGRDWHMARTGSLNAWSLANGGNIHMMAVEFGCADTLTNQYLFGAKPGSGISDAVRLQLIDDLSTSFEAYGIGWSYWSYNEAFTMFKTDYHVNNIGVSPSPATVATSVDMALVNLLLNK